MTKHFLYPSAHDTKTCQGGGILQGSPTHKTRMTPQQGDHVRSRGTLNTLYLHLQKTGDNLKNLYFHYYKTYGQEVQHANS